MYSSNSFNVCPHCGKANSLSARYCSGCGKQLAMPEEVVVCHKCHRNNSPMASFCGSCGAPLRVGAQTKICPKCHKEVDVNSNVCSCGYSFGGFKYASPENAAVDNKAAKSSRSGVGDPRHKGARGIAVFSFILLFLFCYVIVMPVGRFSILGRFSLFRNTAGDMWYAADFVWRPIKAIISGGFGGLTADFGIGGIVWTALILIFAVTIVAQIISIIVQLANAKRHKKANWFHLVMFAITAIAVIAAFVLQTVAGDKTDGTIVVIRNALIPNAGGELFRVGYITILIPVYYLLCFLFSLAFKQKKVKEAVA